MLLVLEVLYKLEVWPDDGVKWKVRGSPKLFILGGGKNVWPKFHDNQSTSCLDISVWNEVLDWVTDIAIPRATPLGVAKKATDIVSCSLKEHHFFVQCFLWWWARLVFLCFNREGEADRELIVHTSHLCRWYLKQRMGVNGWITAQTDA